MALFRKYACMLVMVIISLPALAQQNRFVYLQTDNKQPFYVKMGKVVYSSSAVGYLIIPKLTDNTYVLQIGFPKNEFPEQEVSLEVAGKDAGYLLKNFGEKGWGLFNLQTMAVVMASGKSTGKAVAGNDRKNDNEFSRVLADVVNSPEIAQTKTVQDKPVVQPKPSENQTTIPSTPTTTGIRKIQDDINDESRMMVYVDGVDTITVSIPRAKKPKTEEAKQAVEIKEVLQPEEKKADEVVKVESIKESPSTDLPPQVQEPDCPKMATEADFLKLRKKMASRTNDFDMISDAMKSYRSRCYTTEQVRNLSVLFLSNQGKYSFFDASYNHVSDPREYITLREALTDEYFRTRFDAMIRK